MSQVRQAPHKASLRQVMRKSLANKGVADELIEIILEIQIQMNALLTKLDADTGVAEVDYYSDLALSEVDPDAPR